MECSPISVGSRKMEMSKTWEGDINHFFNLTDFKWPPKCTGWLNGIKNASNNSDLY